MNGLEAALIESARPQALAVLLRPFYGDNPEEALETAENYYSGVAERTRSAQKLVDQIRITREQIQVNAMQISNEGVHMIERMKLNRATSRNALMKDHERRQKKAKKEERRTHNDNAPSPVRVTASKTAR